MNKGREFQKKRYDKTFRYWLFVQDCSILLKKSDKVANFVEQDKVMQTFLKFLSMLIDCFLVQVFLLCLRAFLSGLAIWMFLLQPPCSCLNAGFSVRLLLFICMLWSSCFYGFRLAILDGQIKFAIQTFRTCSLFLGFL